MFHEHCIYSLEHGPLYLDTIFRIKAVSFTEQRINQQAYEKCIVSDLLVSLVHQVASVTPAPLGRRTVSEIYDKSQCKKTDFVFF